MLIQTAEPTSEPVSLAQAKAHLRLDSDNTAEDALISLLISAARRYAESYTGRSFITQGWRLVLDSFPGPGIMGVPWGSTYTLPPNAIVLERGNVQSISTIVYRDMSGATQTVVFDAASNGIQRSTDGTIVADLSGAPARITPAFGRIWPIPIPEIGAVAVNYTAGYGDTAGNVPAGIAQWILMRVGTMYENREQVAILQRGKVEELPYVDSLLDPYNVVMA